MTAPASPFLSLIVATVDRVTLVDELLASLVLQTLQDFEVVVIDQNADDRLVDLVARYAGLLEISHVRHAPRGLSRSRNAGLALARGKAVAFPDDDCRYRADTVARVASFFITEPDADGVTGRAVASAGERAPARFARHAHWLSRRSVFVGGMSCVIFLRAQICARIGPFDERLGLGAPPPWNAAEETDYLARAVFAGARIRYEPELVVEHPGPRGALTAAFVVRAATYSRAFGFVLRRHGAERLHFHVLVIRALAGAAIAMLRGRIDLVRYHWAVARGRVQGWRDGGHAAAMAPPIRIEPARFGDVQ
jgi:glycosyltransferase involved in cell wall biosynthesis